MVYREVHGPGEGSGIGRDFEGKNEVLSVPYPSGMSAEEGQERVLSGFRDAEAVSLKQSRVVTSRGNMVRCRCLTEQIILQNMDGKLQQSLEALEQEAT